MTVTMRLHKTNNDNVKTLISENYLVLGIDEKHLYIATKLTDWYVSSIAINAVRP